MPYSAFTAFPRRWRDTVRSGSAKFQCPTRHSLRFRLPHDPATGGGLAGFNALLGIHCVSAEGERVMAVVLVSFNALLGIHCVSAEWPLLACGGAGVSMPYSAFTAFPRQYAASSSDWT